MNVSINYLNLVPVSILDSTMKILDSWLILPWIGYFHFLGTLIKFPQICSDFNLAESLILLIFYSTDKCVYHYHTCQTRYSLLHRDTGNLTKLFSCEGSLITEYLSLGFQLMTSAMLLVTVALLCFTWQYYVLLDITVFALNFMVTPN